MCKCVFLPGLLGRRISSYNQHKNLVVHILLFCPNYMPFYQTCKLMINCNMCNKYFIAEKHKCAISSLTNQISRWHMILHTLSVIISWVLKRGEAGVKCCTIFDCKTEDMIRYLCWKEKTSKPDHKFYCRGKVLSC